jgi:hypothetical protein
MIEIVKKLTSISLEEMNSIKLLDRHDIKFIFSKDKLNDLLIGLEPYYQILEIDGKRKFSYESLYFDTYDFLFYRQHHNGKQNRYKMRYREYIDSGLVFLEIKFKSNKGKTFKSRIKMDKILTSLEGEGLAFAKKKITDNLKIDVKDIQSTVWTNFSRITLVSLEGGERLTIDLDLWFKDESSKKEIRDVDKIVIAELKKERSAVKSPYIRVAKDLGIMPSSFSKYCTATMLLFENLKRNKFKSRLKNINKIIHGGDCVI